MNLADYVQGGGTDRAQMGAYLNPWKGLQDYVKQNTGNNVATTQLQQNAIVQPTAPVTPQAVTQTQSFAPVTPQAQTPVPTTQTQQAASSSGQWSVGMEQVEHNPFDSSSTGRGLYG